METILDELYDHPEYYAAAIAVVGCTVDDEDTFAAKGHECYDYREYLNDEIRDYIQTHGGFIRLGKWAVLNIL